jgi:hypothetical protein
MDTKRLEQIGETFIVSRLLDGDILVAKPFFDQAGADLVGFTSIDDKAKFCRIQCKYRELKKTTSVQIDSKHVIGAYIFFLYIKAGDQSHFYCLLPADIRRLFQSKTASSKSFFKLNITKKSLMTLETDKAISFTREKVSAIFELIKKSTPGAELLHMISDLVKTTKQMTEKRRQYMELKQLLHEIQLTNQQIKSSEEKIEIMEEYGSLMEKLIKDQTHEK